MRIRNSMLRKHKNTYVYGGRIWDIEKVSEAARREML